MPRIRPAKTKEEIERAPQGEPLDIELEAAPEPEAVELPEPQPVQAEPPEPPPELEKPPELPPEEADLRKRLADLERSEAENQRRLADYQRQLQEAQRAHTQAQEDRDDAYYAGVLNAIDAAEAQANVANQAIDAAVEAGDREAAAMARRNLAKAEAAIIRYEEQKAQYEESRKARPEPQQRPPQQPDQQNAFEAAISQYPKEAQDRFRAHPEYVTNPRMTAKLVAAHWDAIEAGHAQYTSGYFQYLDDRVFNPKPTPSSEERIGEQVQEIKQRSLAVPSAPPTRDVPSAATGKPQSTRVTLTPEERDIARSTKSKFQTVAEAELEYARNKLKYAEAKKSGQYQERG